MARLRSARLSIALVGAGALALVLDARLGERGGAGTPLALEIALALLACLPIAFMKRAPLASVLALEVGVAVCALTFATYEAPIGILTVVLFLAAVHGDRRRSLIFGAATALALTVTLALLSTTGPGFEAGAFARVLLVLGAIMVGDAVRTRRELGAARREREARTLAEREQRARQRVAAERLRIARELHDTLAHALVAINVRAGVAAHLGSEPRDTGALSEIKQVSAQALRDLRATLDLLRDGGEETPRLPAQGIEALPQLLQGVRSAGLVAHSAVDVDGAAVSASVSQTAFRIVQESLTNVLRHAGASRADVLIRASADVLAVDVVDDGHGANGRAPASSAGHGLRGMSERVLALGGQLSAGPLQPQGWRVHAELPLGHGRG